MVYSSGKLHAKNPIKFTTIIWIKSKILEIFLEHIKIFDEY